MACRDHAIELSHLLIDQLQPLQLQSQHLPMHEPCSVRQSIDQLLLQRARSVLAQSHSTLQRDDLA
jgi:hypothetical protein